MAPRKPPAHQWPRGGDMGPQYARNIIVADARVAPQPAIGLPRRGPMSRAPPPPADFNRAEVQFLVLRR